MMATSWFGPAVCMMAVIALRPAYMPMAHAAPPAGGTTASGGSVRQSGNCPDGRQADGHCLPGGPGSPPATPGAPIHPPAMPPGTPPATPPVTPITPPAGRPSATRPQDPELPLYVIGWAKATFHIHDADRDIVYDSDQVPLTFLKRAAQDMEGNTQYILAPVLINQPPNPREEEANKLQVIWMVEGREFDCTVKGKAVVTLPTGPGGRI